MRILFGLMLITLWSCSEKAPEIQKIKNEVWSVKEVNGEFVKDEITLRETYEYDDDGIEIGHLIYTPTGDLSGKELAVFDEQYDHPVGTKYYTAEDSLLSYYSLKYDKKGRKKSKWGFDASNDELLRMEEFSYDAKDNMIKRTISNSDNQLQRIYEFTHDAYGNETGLTVKDADGTIRFTEEFRIMKLSAHHDWVENWGWRNEIPVTFRTRELVYKD